MTKPILIATLIALVLLPIANDGWSQQTPSPAATRAPIGPPAFLPDAAAARVVSVTKGGASSEHLVIITEAIAIKENGPKETVARFGEVYAFSPATIFVRENQPTTISFWNLQPDDQHDFAIVNAAGKPLMDLALPPLSQTSYVFTFHRPGIWHFKCLVHQPAMSGQVLVLPAH
ncbi:MAG: hypothetical protein IVW54_14300 [Candidatus Binataceae bacterium]|nr:hypothetical protein [Candidatus Binataceae bacterium]